MYTLFLLIYFFCPLFIALFPGILREDHYGEIPNDIISLVSLFLWSIFLGMYLPHPGADDYTSITRQLLISLILIPMPPRIEIMRYLQHHVHLYQFTRSCDEDSH